MTFAIRLLFTFWWIGAITIVAMFTGSLVSLFASDHLYLPFYDIDGMINAIDANGFTMIIDRNVQQRFATAKAG